MKSAAYMIEVMQAFERGESIEASPLTQIAWHSANCPCWNWEKYDYRIAPKPLECWVLKHDSGSISFFGCNHADCLAHASRYGGQPVKMREVIE